MLGASSRERERPGRGEEGRETEGKRNAPLSPTLFLRSESIDDLKSAASSEVSPEMSNRSNSTGTLVCCMPQIVSLAVLRSLCPCHPPQRTSKISSTAWVISLPTPSPGMRVTE